MAAITAVRGRLGSLGRRQRHDGGKGSPRFFCLLVSYLGRLYTHANFPGAAILLPSCTLL
jgi:hypothetical protein